MLDFITSLFRRPWAPKTFVYQLQGTNLSSLHSCQADVKVVAASIDPTAVRGTVFAHLSIRGENLPYLHRCMAEIINAGFDGVVLAHGEEDVETLHDLSANARRAKPSFKLLSHGGLNLIGKGNFNALIDGVIADSVMIRDGKLRYLHDCNKDLRTLKSLGKPTFIIEYGVPRAHMEMVKYAAKANGSLLLTLDDDKFNKLVVSAT